MKSVMSAAIAAWATAAGAAQVDVLSAGAVESAFHDVAGAWERSSGNTVKASFGPVGELRKRLEAGATPDVVIVPAELVAPLAAQGKVDAATRRDLGVVSIGAAVHEGAPRPDISTPEALRRTLLEAKSVTYMDPTRGTSGKHFDESVLPALGIRDAVRAKATLGQGGSVAEKVARGEAEIGFQQITELLPVKGVTVLGPLPDALQKRTTYTAVVAKDAPHAAQARALVDALASPAGRKAFVERGFALP
ncbi:MAG TPA: molybdate ABC transporter substrate-binding protein [Usitatibacter sp.]|jgi:molybdate transport system substrate-binding protein|nr:molybdate ABC transporter substrate-binding protein [Usitatibacter sp.]